MRFAHGNGLQNVRMTVHLRRQFPDDGGCDVSGDVHQFTTTDTHHVTVVQHPATDRNSVYEGAVVALQISELRVPAHPLDDAVLARDRRVLQRNLIRGITAY